MVNASDLSERALNHPSPHLRALFSRVQSVPPNAALRHTVDEVGDRDDKTGFGSHSITFWGSMMLNFNNIMGPALVVLPLLNQEAGWLAPTVLGTVFCLLSAWASTMLAEAMQRIPGNRAFNKRYEFVTLMRHYYGRRGFLLGQVLYNASLQANNVAAMIVCSQVMDASISAIFGRSIAVNYGSWPPSLATLPKGVDAWQAATADKTNLLSIGYLVTACICVPLGWINLEDNMAFQWVSGVLSIFMIMIFLAAFGSKMAVSDDWPDPLTPPVCGWLSQVHVLGVSIFFHSYVVTIPSWVNEKAPKVDVNWTVWGPSALTVVVKIVFGLMGAWAYKLLSFPRWPKGDPRGEPLPGSDNILNWMLKAGESSYIHVCAYLFSIVTLLPGIPVLMVMTRYNLLSGGLCRPKSAFIWAVIVPWVATAFFYERQILVAFCNWIALIVQGYTNFVLPVAVYRKALKKYPYEHEHLLETWHRRRMHRRKMWRRRTWIKIKDAWGGLFGFGPTPTPPPPGPTPPPMAMAEEGPEISTPLLGSSPEPGLASGFTAASPIPSYHNAATYPNQYQSQNQNQNQNQLNGGRRTSGSGSVRGASHDGQLQPVLDSLLGDHVDRVAIEASVKNPIKAASKRSIMASLLSVDSDLFMSVDADMPSPRSPSGNAFRALPIAEESAEYREALLSTRDGNGSAEEDSEAGHAEDEESEEPLVHAIPLWLGIRPRIAALVLEYTMLFLCTFALAFTACTTIWKINVDEYADKGDGGGAASFISMAAGRVASAARSAVPSGGLRWWLEAAGATRMRLAAGGTGAGE